jgi:hypothetical protein
MFAFSLLFMGLSASPAQAGTLNHLGRWLGLGWSDGYHAGEQPSGATWATVSPQHPAIGPAPAKVENARRGQPRLPSQRMSERPVYWYR